MGHLNFVHNLMVRAKNVYCACTRFLCMHKIPVHAQHSLCMHNTLVHAQEPGLGPEEGAGPGPGTGPALCLGPRPGSCACTRVLCMHKECCACTRILCMHKNLNILDVLDDRDIFHGFSICVWNPQFDSGPVQICSYTS